MKKRERDVKTKTKKNKKKYEIEYYLKKNKKYRNGDLDFNGNSADYLKKQKHSKKCIGCCWCLNKKKSNNKTEKEIISKEESLKLENDNEEEIMKFPSFENPLECLNTNSEAKQLINVYHEHNLKFLSNYNSWIDQKLRQLDEKKSNKKKFNNLSNYKKKNRQAKYIVTDFDKGEVKRKVYSFTRNQLEEFTRKFNKYVTKENDQLIFKMEEIPNNVLLEIKEFVDKIDNENLGNPLHQKSYKESEVFIFYTYFED